MRYIKAEEILPAQLLEQIQQYVDGQSIYIPRKRDNRRVWGSGTGARKDLIRRNYCMYKKYRSGITVKELAAEYCLTEKSVQRIIRMWKPSGK